MLGRSSLGSSLCFLPSGLRLFSLCMGPSLAAPCGGHYPLAIEIFEPLTGASRDFGEMALNSVKLASADFGKARGCSIGIKHAKRCSTIIHCTTLNLVHAAGAA
jgi:hypothetical protein